MTRDPITPFIIERIPHFISENYPGFYQFLVHYFEFLEETGKPLQVLEDFYSNLEANNNEEYYVNKILEELGFPSNIEISIPKSHLIHYLRDFYLSRGNVDSFKFLFRLIYNSDVSINYPRDNLFVPSWATYSGRFYIYTTTTARNTNNYNEILAQNMDYSISVRGVSSKTVCAVENILEVIFNGTFYLQIEIDSNLVEYTPYEGVEIFINGTNFKITENIMSVLDLDILDGGSQYKVGDVVDITGCNIPGIAKVKKISDGYVREITITNAGTGYVIGDQIRAIPMEHGHSFSAEVYKVNETGGIVNINILCSGFEYRDIPTLQVTSKAGRNAILTANSNNIGKIESVEFLEPYADIPDIEQVQIDVSSLRGRGAVLSPIDKTIFAQRKSFQNRRGFLGSNCIVVDSKYYQQFSYEVVSNIPQNEYKYVVDNLLHPPGFVRFSKVIISYDQDLQNKFETTYGYTPTTVIYNTDLSFGIGCSTDSELYKIIEDKRPEFIVNSINNLEYYKNCDSYNVPSNRWDTANIAYIQDNSHMMSDALDAQLDDVTPN